MRTPNSLKTDNDSAYISKQFKQFLHSFSIKQIADIPYSPQTHDWTNTLHTVTANKKVNKRKYTGTLLSSLFRANFTRFWCNIVFKPITIVSVTLFLFPMCRILKAGRKWHKKTKTTTTTTKKHHFANGLFVPKNIRNVECLPSFQVCLGSVVILFNTLNSEIQQLLSCICFSKTRSNIFGCEQHFICQVVLHHLFNNLT